MNGIIAAFFGIIIVCPFIVTLVFLVGMRKMGKAPASVIGLAADVTTPFLFLAVYIVTRTMLGEGVGVYVTGIAILIAIVYVVKERLYVKDFRIVRLLRRIWRFYFLVLSIAYLLLLIVGAILKIIEYVK